MSKQIVRGCLAEIEIRDVVGVQILSLWSCIERAAVMGLT